MLVHFTSRVFAVSAVLVGAFALFLLVTQYSEFILEAQGHTPEYRIEGSTYPNIHASAWGIFDVQTGEVIVGENINTAFPIASVTKLMTAKLVFEDPAMSATTTTVSRVAVATEGRAGSLTPGQTFTLRELLFPLLLESSNDAAEAIAERFERSHFMDLMNSEATTSDFIGTRYDDPSGLSEENISSVVDLARLYSDIYRNQRHILDITRLSSYTSEEQQIWFNNDPARGIPGFLGGKHGYTSEAGRTFVGGFEETLANDVERKIGVVLLNNGDIAADIELLRRYARKHIEYVE